MTYPFYLTYTTQYTCISNDTCALDYAQKMVMDVDDRINNFANLSADLTPILRENRLPGSTLMCYDNDICSPGYCKIEYDTVTNTQTERHCERTINLYLSVYDNGKRGSFGIMCNRTKCNTVETLNAVKVVFAKYKLTDVNGRMPVNDTDDGDISRAHTAMASTLLVFALTLICNSIQHLRYHVGSFTL